MGSFSLNDTLSNMFNEYVDGAITNALKEYEYNQRYPSVTSLKLTALPAEKVGELEKIKTGLFGRGTKKQFIKSVEDGSAGYAEVVVLARCHRVVDRSERDPNFCTYKYFYKIADIEGNVIREDVPMIDDKYALSLELNGGNSSSETGNADKVDPAEYEHMYLLRYYIKDNQHYVLLTKDQFDDMSALVNNADNNYLFTEDGVGYKW